MHMKKTYTLQWQNPAGGACETITENLTSAAEVFIAVEKLQELWKIPLEHRPKFYRQLKIIEISKKGKREIPVNSLMPASGEK